MKVWLEGRVVPLARACVPVCDHGFLYGDSVYETMRTFGGRLFRLQDHLRRLRSSAAGLRLDVAWSDEDLAALLESFRAQLEGEEHYLRLILTRGSADLGYDWQPGQRPRLLILGGPFTPVPPEVLDRGLRAATVSVPRSLPHPGMPGLKTGNLLNLRLGHMEAREKGADEAIMLNLQGELAEASSSNLFLVLPGPVLATPSIESGCLPGVTRTVVLELARQDGMSVREERLPGGLLARAEEVFLTSTTRSIAPVACLDGRPLACPGPVTRRLRDLFRAYAGGL
jgi:branched-chain amino acid aminotransferase